LHLVELSSTALGFGTWEKKKQLPAESNGSITLDNKWYGTCKKRWHCRLNFLHQFCTSREGTQQYLLGLQQV